MMQLNSKLQKSIEEFRNRTGKATFHKITEYNGLKGTFEGVFFSFACAPLDHSLTLEKTHILQFLHCCLRYFALTPACWKIYNCFIFNLGLVFLGSHFNVMSFGSGATRGANGCHRQLGSVNLNLTAARSQEDKNPRSYRTVYMVSDGNFVNTWKINKLFSSQESFITNFVMSYWFLNLNWEI